MKPRRRKSGEMAKKVASVCTAATAVVAIATSDGGVHIDVTGPIMVGSHIVQRVQTK